MKSRSRLAGGLFTLSLLGLCCRSPTLNENTPSSTISVRSVGNPQAQPPTTSITESVTSIHGVPESESARRLRSLLGDATLVTAIYDAVDWGELWRSERELTRAGGTLAVVLYHAGTSIDSIDVYVEDPPYELLCAPTGEWSCTVVNYGSDAVVPATRARGEYEALNGIRARLTAPSRRIQRRDRITESGVARVLCEAMRFTGEVPGQGAHMTFHVTSTVPELGVLDAVDWKHQRLYSIWWSPSRTELRNATWTEIIPNVNDARILIHLDAWKLIHLQR